jgi:RHS repeat-associated protein
MTLAYEDHSNSALRQYNGNISGQTWGPQSNPNLHHYNYSYDKLNRLLTGTSDEGFNESLSYDVMGNISSLARNPMGTNTYTYSGNQLSSISGFVNGSFGYDVNGNQISDGAKGVTLAYNYLNLPQTITKASTSEVMTNTWLASGVKLKKVTGGLTRDYVGGIEYNNGSIEFIQTEEGRARPNGGSYFYEYMLKDHLGNTRVLFDQNGAVKETSDYYPFGLQVARSGNTVPSPENRYKYNGKELQTELGLNQYDYGARFYDPVIGRWNTVDPLAEEMRRYSPYTYVYNNPLRFIDPDGMKGTSTHTDEDGNVLAVFDDGDLGVYKHDKNADGSSVTKAQINKRHSKSTSAGGEKMGETEFWDEFIVPGTDRAEGSIIFSNDPAQSWDPLVAWGNEHANNQDLSITMEESKLNGVLDIKNNKAWAPDGPMTGRLLNGKFATARSAGNYLAGMNGVTGTFQGMHISGETYMKLAGAYQVGKLSAFNAARIVTFGTSFGPAPYYGEQPYSGRRILQGINAGLQKR